MFDIWYLYIKGTSWSGVVISFDNILFVIHSVKANMKLPFLLMFVLVNILVKGQNSLENFKDHTIKAIMEIAENLDNGRNSFETLLLIKTWEGMQAPVSNKESYLFSFYIL